MMDRGADVDAIDLRPFFPGWNGEGYYAVTTPMHDEPKSFVHNGYLKTPRWESREEKNLHLRNSTSMILKTGKRTTSLYLLHTDSIAGPAMVIENPGRNHTHLGSLFVVTPRSKWPSIFMQYCG